MAGLFVEDWRNLNFLKTAGFRVRTPPDEALRRQAVLQHDKAQQRRIAVF
jgi:hypothetical protein